MNEERYYLYRWIRLDKNQPFYIGIGTKTKDDLKYGTYKRSYTEKKGNPIWKNIINKSPYRIEILIESNDYNFILQKEIEFISLYGRIDLKSGILANMTDGGEGTRNIIISEENRKRRSIAKKGIKKSIESINKQKETMRQRGYKVSKETIEKMKNTKAIPVLQFSLNGLFIKKWESNAIAANTLNIKRYSIASAANVKNTKSFTSNNFIWVYEKDWLNKNLEKFNLAINRAKTGKIKKNIDQNTKYIVLNEYLKMDKSIPKGKRIDKLSKKFEINYSTIRAMVYGLK